MGGFTHTVVVVAATPAAHLTILPILCLYIDGQVKH